MVSIVEKRNNVANGLVSFFNKKNVVGLNKVFSLGCALHFSSDMSDVFLSKMVRNLKRGISKRLGDDNINLVIVKTVLYMFVVSMAVFHGLLFVSTTLVLSHCLFVKFIYLYQ